MVEQTKDKIPLILDPNQTKINLPLDKDPDRPCTARFSQIRPKPVGGEFNPSQWSGSTNEMKSRTRHTQIRWARPRSRGGTTWDGRHQSPNRLTPRPDRVGRTRSTQSDNDSGQTRKSDVHNKTTQPVTQLIIHKSDRGSRVDPNPGRTRAGAIFQCTSQSHPTMKIIII